jgi:hypothetical protein
MRLRNAAPGCTRCDRAPFGGAGAALAISRAIGDRVGEAGALNSVGWHYAHGGEYHQAQGLFRELGDNFNTACTLTRLGDNRHHAADPATARDAWHQALQILDELQHPDADRVRTKLGQLSDPLT